jgi:hypothetical protein
VQIFYIEFMARVDGCLTPKWGQNFGEVMKSRRVLEEQHDLHANPLDLFNAPE